MTRMWDHKAEPADERRREYWRLLCESRSVSFALAARRPTMTPLQVTAKSNTNYYPRSSDQKAELKRAHCRCRSRSTSVRVRNHRFDSSGGKRTRGEHLVDVLEGAGLVHFSGEISAPRARARRIWRGLEGSGRGGAVRRSRSGRARAAGCPSGGRGVRWRERWNRRRVVAVVGSSAVQRVAPRPSWWFMSRLLPAESNSPLPWCKVEVLLFTG